MVKNPCSVIAQKNFDEAWNRLQGFDAFKHLSKQSFFDRAKNDVTLFPQAELLKIEANLNIE